jgi:hypothetical protein
MKQQQVIDQLKAGKYIVKKIGLYYEESYYLDYERVNGNTFNALMKQGIIQEVKNGRLYSAGGLNSITYEIKS